MDLLPMLPQFPHTLSVSPGCVYMLKMQPLLSLPTLATPRLWLDRVFLGYDPCVLRQPLITYTDSHGTHNNLTTSEPSLRGSEIGSVALARGQET